jgi:hypothetical protein
MRDGFAAVDPVTPVRGPWDCHVAVIEQDNSPPERPIDAQLP